MLPVNEIFATIQGEGAFTGTSSWFIRLQGCPVGCGWCDTKHTWDVDPANARHWDVIDAKRETPSAVFAYMDVAEIVAALERRPRVRHVVITGGEPCMHDLRELTTAILEAGRSVQVETSGTFHANVHEDTWLTVSPKLDMPGGLPILAGMLGRANEIKHPVGKQADIDKLRERVLPHIGQVPVYLQPLSRSYTATRLCVDAALLHGFRVSIQVHKYIDIR